MARPCNQRTVSRLRTHRPSSNGSPLMRSSSRTRSKTMPRRSAAAKKSLPESLDTPTDLPRNAVMALSHSLNGLVADAFALYLKTKNFHWHMSGPHFRDYHLLLDEQADQI